MSARDPEAAVSRCSKLPELLDQIVSALLKQRRYVEPERLRSLEVQHQLELGRLLDWQIGWFFAAEDAVDV
jgi:hypothetical protein